MNYILEPRLAAASPIPMCSARGDASAIMMNIGYKPLYFPRSKRTGRKERYLGNLQFIMDSLKVYRTLKPGDSVFMQWPFDGCKFMPLLHKVLRKKCPNLTMLVHDINILRGIGGGMRKTL